MAHSKKKAHFIATTDITHSSSAMTGPVATSKMRRLLPNKHASRIVVPFLLLLLSSVRITPFAGAFSPRHGSSATGLRIHEQTRGHISNVHHRNNRCQTTQLRWIEERQQTTTTPEYITYQLDAVDDSRQPQQQIQQNRPMTIVPPPTATASKTSKDSLAIKILHVLDSILRKDEVKEYLQHLYDSGNGESAGVRRIQAGRFEVFLRRQDLLVNSSRRRSNSGDDHPNGDDAALAFDWIAAQAGATLGLGMTSRQIRDAIINYAEKQANAIPQYQSRGFVYHNFSLLISYEKCFQQYPHIDTLQPNAQFSLTVTDDSPGTIWYEDQAPAFTSARQLYQLGSADGVANDHDNGTNKAKQEEPCPWAEVMDSNPKVRSLLRRYGAVLSPHLIPHQPQLKYRGGIFASHSLLPTGTLLSLPGGVVHAGPSCEDFRCILFFSGYPTASTSDNVSPAAGVVSHPYDPNFQYFGSMLLSDIIAATWTELSVTDRVYLLEKLVTYLKQPPLENRRLHEHLKVGSTMYEFAGFVETGLLRTREELERYIRDFAQKDDIRL